MSFFQLAEVLNALRCHRRGACEQLDNWWTWLGRLWCLPPLSTLIKSSATGEREGSVSSRTRWETFT